ncbi:hypothetical protein LEP1GSC204_4099 [Leptospira interrogans serovar Copenhageni str. M20]|nr:hypothetical protein LEP1GSC009_4516 [Leptospira interrogans serovar Grippotyphosa str. Andaman]EMO37650.1 hypothetical protein LEP1GSC177_2957 [Leptospira interrogans str. MMD3731]EMY53722.1 hypothetical protein LEP1GSC204_4099 [Leptospira interrogans serovar Copenhageni str. M20]
MIRFKYRIYDTSSYRDEWKFKINSKQHILYFFFENIFIKNFSQIFFDLLFSNNRVFLILKK